MAAKSKVDIVGIIAWGVAGLCAIVALALGLWGSQQAGRADGLRKAVVEVATTVGIKDVVLPTQVVKAVEGEAADEEAAPGETPVVPDAIELTPALLKDPAVLAQVVEQATSSIQATQQDLASTQDALTSAQAQASSAQNQVTTLSQQANEQSAKTESLSKELAVAAETLAKAQADLAQTAEEAKTAAEAAEKQAARLEKTVARLKDEKAASVAKLQAEIEALKNPPLEGMGEDSTGELEAMYGDDGGAEDVVDPEPMVEEGRVIGASEMFSFIRYGEDQSLFFRLWDGQTLTYENVTPDVADRLVQAVDRLDVTYRFQVQGQFKSVPPDSIVIRKFWKWQRRHKARGDVRYAEPDAPVVEEESATAEETEE